MPGQQRVLIRPELSRFRPCRLWGTVPFPGAGQPSVTDYVCIYVGSSLRKTLPCSDTTTCPSDAFVHHVQKPRVPCEATLSHATQTLSQDQETPPCPGPTLGSLPGSGSGSRSRDPPQTSYASSASPATHPPSFLTQLGPFRPIPGRGVARFCPTAAKDLNTPPSFHGHASTHRCPQ